jgi:hypothetical protein
MVPAADSTDRGIRRRRLDQHDDSDTASAPADIRSTDQDARRYDFFAAPFGDDFATPLLLPLCPGDVPK